jgi:hypothetical protein
MKLRMHVNEGAGLKIILKVTGRSDLLFGYLMKANPSNSFRR